VLNYENIIQRVSLTSYLFKFNGHMIDDETDTFEIYLFINPDNYNIYLEKIQQGSENLPTTYKRVYKSNDKIRQYVDDILEIKK
jgi:hypothetical protein